MVYKNITITPQSIICIYDQNCIKDTLNLIHSLNFHSLVEHSFVTLNFDKLETITAAASVLLFSEINRIRALSIHGFQALKIKSSSSRKGSVSLNSMGFLRAINIDIAKYPDTIWKGNSKFLTGTNPEEDLKKIAGLMCNLFELKKLPFKLSAAISETLLNIKHHAYLPINIEGKLYYPPDFMINRWWLCFNIFKTNNKNILKCVILDRGQGITNTIKDTLPNTLKVTEDQCFIHAMKTGVTRTQNQERGKGSEDIKMPIDITKNERDFLSIMSHTVTYTILGEHTPSCNSSSHVIPGTIVEWQLEFNND